MLFLSEHTQLQVLTKHSSLWLLFGNSLRVNLQHISNCFAFDRVYCITSSYNESSLLLVFIISCSSSWRNGKIHSIIPLGNRDFIWHSCLSLVYLSSLASSPQYIYIYIGSSIGVLCTNYGPHLTLSQSQHILVF